MNYCPLRLSAYNIPSTRREALALWSATRFASCQIGVSCSSSTPQTPIPAVLFSTPHDTPCTLLRYALLQKVVQSYENPVI